MTKQYLLAIGAEVRRLRKANDLTQLQLARAAGMHLNHVGLIERGQRNPSVMTLKALAEALGITAGDIVRGADRRFEKTRA